MDRKFQSDDQWYASPLLDLQLCKEDLLECRETAEDTIDRSDDGTEFETEKDKERELWYDNLTSVDGVTEEEATEVIDEVSNLDMFLESSTDVSTRRLDDMKGNKKLLEESNLFTHKNIVKRNEFMNSSRQRKSAYVTSLKYDKYVLEGAENTNLFRPQCSMSSKCADDFVITVDALFPNNRMLQSMELRSSRLLKPASKFLLRGDTTLFDLRRKLCCMSDTVVPLDNGVELEPPNLDMSTAFRYPSSFIFIHDTFYVDSAAENAQDISFPIRNFMQQRKIFDPVEAQKMEGVKISDLKLRLGLPYVFQHSGNCEHLLVFHDLRLLHESDPKELEKYPYTLFEKGSERRCEICRRSHVEFVVEQHELLPLTFTFFCRSCFQEFNFVHGVKTHSFRAWPYTELQNRDQMDWPSEERDHDMQSIV
ncbi:unnamed protein product [Caenorhabditis sp. 36 PRJEB53466]|nr:unnamed protein product [Caenorhabditis sp. 36 PRJEB53466]